jgi:hypothetical protein
MKKYLLVLLIYSVWGLQSCSSANNTGPEDLDGDAIGSGSGRNGDCTESIPENLDPSVDVNCDGIYSYLAANVLESNYGQVLPLETTVNFETRTIVTNHKDQEGRLFSLKTSTHDEQGNPTSIIIEYYNLSEGSSSVLNSREEINYGDLEVRSLRYDGDGKLMRKSVLVYEAKSEGNKALREELYDAEGQKIYTVTYSYDSQNRLSSMNRQSHDTFSEGVSVRYEYDKESFKTTKIETSDSGEIFLVIERSSTEWGEEENRTIFTPWIHSEGSLWLEEDIKKVDDRKFVPQSKTVQTYYENRLIKKTSKFQYSKEGVFPDLRFVSKLARETTFEYDELWRLVRSETKVYNLSDGNLEEAQMSERKYSNYIPIQFPIILPREAQPF